MGTDRLLWSVPDFRKRPVLRKGEKRRERESKRKERAKMGTDRFLWSVPDFRKRPVLRKGEKRRERERVREKRERKWGLTCSLGLYPIFALPTTNNLSYHPTLVLAQKSRPSSTVPEHGPVLGESEKRRERERVREKRERKWGLTGSCGLYPIFAKDPSLERARRGEKERE